MFKTPLRRATAAAALALCTALTATGCSALSSLGGASKSAEANTTSFAQLQVGNCFNAASSSQVADAVEVVACTQPHTDEVFATATLTGSSLPTGDDLSEQVTADCANALADYVGTDETDISYGYYTAVDNAAYATDKSLVCTIGLTDGGTMTRSAKGVENLAALTAP